MTTPAREWAKNEGADDFPGTVAAHPETPDQSREKEIKKWTTVTMPGSSEKLKEEIASVSPEGRPADAKAGPGAILMMVGIALPVILVIAAIIVGWKFGWAAGMVVFGIGLMMVLFNPEVWAAVMRARDRKQVLDEEEQRGEWRP